MSQGTRRRPNAQSALLALAIGAVLLAGWWFWWVPNWRPALAPGEGYGIDVSAAQDAINWRRVVRDGIQFAYIKATEGGDFVDARFEENWARAADAGLRRGAYHFFTLCRAGRVQAHNFLRVAPPDPDALSPAVDLELAGNCSDRPPRDVVYRELDEFLELVEAKWDRETVLYVGKDWLTAYPLGDNERPLWLRRFLLRPAEPWFIWQLHGYAHVEGIEGGVDLNVMRAP